jgi:hypothetical protein
LTEEIVVGAKREKVLKERKRDDSRRGAGGAEN